MHIYVLPMKAKPLTAKKYEKIMSSPYYYAEEKLKGIRAFIHIHSDHQVITSAAGKILPNLEHWPKYYEIPDLTGSILDCEAYRRGWDDAVINGYIHRQDRCLEQLEIMPWIFDIPSIDDEQEVRLKILNMYTSVYSEYFTHRPKIVRGGLEHKLNFYTRIVASGGEGIMLKNLKTLYHFNLAKLENTWYKLKHTDPYDVVIQGWLPGQGKYENLIGSLIYGQYRGKEFIPLGTVSGFDDELRRAMTENFEAYRGKVAVVEASERTRGGALENPRFLWFREDKLPEDCIWEDDAE